MIKRILTTLVLVGLASVGAAAYLGFFETPSPPQISQLTVTRGDILQTVTATGTLQATRTVDVGTQVSGVVKRMYVDYNSIVKAGELIAEIDPQVSQQALDSAKASLERANIDLKGQQDTVDADARTRDREEQLFDKDLATEQDKETAELTVKEDQAVLAQDRAAVEIAQGGVEQAQVNLDHCTIRSPIDGVVITRDADEGQTVAATLAVPSLYVLAADVTNLILLGSVDESDIGKLHPDQEVGFNVDAYPGRTFHGTLTQVRLNSVTTNNVVTYQAVVSVPNPDLRLLPSMTANLKIQIATAPNALRVPATALRFRPTAEMFEALHQPVIPPAPLPVPTEVASASTGKSPAQTAGELIDRFFSIAPRPDTPGQVWVMDNGQLRAVPIRLGITDNTWTEVLSGSLSAGDQVVTNITLPSTKKPVAPTAGNPLLGPQRPGGAANPGRGATGGR